MNCEFDACDRDKYSKTFAQYTIVILKIYNNNGESQ